MELNCPRCENTKLDEIEVGDVYIDRCPRCAGIWFDNSEIVQIAKKSSKSLERVDSIVPPVEGKQNDMFCPKCKGVALRQFEFERQNGRTAVLFRCVSCLGTWLDRGELREIEDPHLIDTLASHFSNL